MLMRAVQSQTDTNQSDAIGNFDKLVSHINNTSWISIIPLEWELH